MAKEFQIVDENKISLGNNILFFKYPIKEIQNNNEKIFILLEIPKGIELGYDELNNVYCYDYNGTLLWQIAAPKFKEEIEFIQSLYVGIDFIIESNKLFAIDFLGRRFEINQENGNPINFEIVK